MEKVVLSIHLMLALALIATVLLQKSEGGALGIGGGNSMMAGRGAANLLTRATAILAAGFMGTSLTLAMMAGGHQTRRSILDAPAATGSAVPGQALPGSSEAPAAPAAPAAPSVPVSQ